MPNIWPIKSAKHSYGYNKDKYNFGAVYHLITGAALPPQSPNNAALAPAISDQDGVAACGGFSWAEYFYCRAKQISQPVDSFSENWIYNLARWMEGTLSQDAGLSNDDALTMVAKFGILLEKYWPFKNVLDTAAPSSVRQAEAIKYPNFLGVRVDGGIDGIRSAMAAGHPVVLGGPFFQEWEDAPATGILPIPTPQSVIAGGHDWLGLDYDDATRLIYAQNSWGIGYAKGGRFYVPYDALTIMAQMGGYDCHYALFDVLPTPLPPVPPFTPSSCSLGNGIAAVMNILTMQKLRGRKGQFIYANPPENKK
jgi:hypothetical protein